MVCGVTDVACQVRQAIVDLIAPILLPVIVFLVALFIIPKIGGWRGVALSILIIFGILWWYGLIPGLVSLPEALKSWGV